LPEYNNKKTGLTIYNDKTGFFNITSYRL
jgi:hypothetical protein